MQQTPNQPDQTDIEESPISQLNVKLFGGQALRILYQF